MNMNHAATIVNTGITTCKVVFPYEITEQGESVIDSMKHEYTYKLTRSMAQEFEKNETKLVVVQAKGSLSIAELVSIDEETDIDTSFAGTYKWVVCAVNFTEVNKAIEQHKKIAKTLSVKQRQAYRDQFLRELGFSSEADLQLELNASDSNK